MKPPIILRDPNDLTLFRSRESAEGYIEHPEYVEGCDAFDSEGRCLRFEVIRKPRRWPFRRWHVEEPALREAETEPTHQGELRQTLLFALQAVGDETDQTLSLEELLDRATNRFGVV